MDEEMLEFEEIIDKYNELVGELAACTEMKKMVFLQGQVLALGWCLAKWNYPENDDS